MRACFAAGQRAPVGRFAWTAKRVLVTLRSAATALLAAAGLCGAAWAGVDANTATLAQLDALSGIGPKIAQRIVDERGSRPFRDLADLQERVRGIGPATLKKLTGAGLAVGASGAGRAASHPAVIEVAPQPKVQPQTPQQPRSQQQPPSHLRAQPQARSLTPSQSQSRPGRAP